MISKELFTDLVAAPFIVLYMTFIGGIFVGGILLTGFAGIITQDIVNEVRRRKSR